MKSTRKRNLETYIVDYEIKVNGVGTFEETREFQATSRVGASLFERNRVRPEVRNQYQAEYPRTSVLSNINISPKGRIRKA